MRRRLVLSYGFFTPNFCSLSDALTPLLPSSVSPLRPCRLPSLETLHAAAQRGLQSPTVMSRLNVDTRAGAHRSYLRCTVRGRPRPLPVRIFATQRVGLAAMPCPLQSD